MTIKLTRQAKQLAEYCLVQRYRKWYGKRNRTPKLPPHPTSWKQWNKYYPEVYLLIDFLFNRVHAGEPIEKVIEEIRNDQIPDNYKELLKR